MLLYILHYIFYLLVLKNTLFSWFYNRCSSFYQVSFLLHIKKRRGDQVRAWTRCVHQCGWYRVLKGRTNCGRNPTAHESLSYYILDLWMCLRSMRRCECQRWIICNACSFALHTSIYQEGNIFAEALKNPNMQTELLSELLYQETISCVNLRLH